MNKLFLTCILLLFYISLCGQVQQRKFTLQKLALPAGFPANTIRGTYADQNGFLWIFCSNNRFYRFDGQEMLPATTLFGNNIIRYVNQTSYIDKNNNLWIGNLDNLCRIDLRTFTQHTYKIKAGPLLFENNLTGITQDANYMYFSTVNGQVFRADHNYQFKKIIDFAAVQQQDEAVPAINYMSIYEGALYFFAAGKGIFRHMPDGSTTRITGYRKRSEDRSYSWMKVVGSALLAYDDAGALISIKGTTSYPVVSRVKGKAGTFYPLDAGYYVSFLGNKSIIQQQQGNELKTIDEFPLRASLGILETNGNGVFMRNNEGLYRLGSTQRQAFDEFSSFRDINKNSISIRHIFTFGDQTWIGTYDGLFSMDSQLQRTVKKSGEIIYTSIPELGRKNSMLLGTEGAGLMRMDSTGTIAPLITNREIANPFVTTLTYLDKNRLLLGTYQGFYCYNIATKKLRVLQVARDPAQALFSKIRKVEVQSGRVYFACEKGLYWFSINNPSEIHPLKNFPAAGSVYDFQIRYPLIWCGTRDSGVVTYNLENETFQTYTVKNGLSDNAVFNLAEENGYLVCGTGNGLSLINLRTGKIRTFNQAHGLPSNEFNQGALLVKDHRFFMGTTQGIVSFTVPELLASEKLKVEKPMISALTITDVEGGRQRSIYNLGYDAKKPVSLSAGERMITIQFGSLHKYLERDSLYYQLNDQTKWLPINGSSLILTGLEPGANTVSLSTDRKASFAATTFHISPYFFETGLFKLLMVISIIALVTLYLRFRIMKIKRDHTLRTRISSDLHDDIGSVLTGISMQADYLLYSSNKQLDIKRYLKQISQSSKEATGAMSDMVWSIDARNDDWDSLMGRVRHYADGMFETAGIEMSFSIIGAPKKGNIKQQRRQDFYMIVKEIVNNICKHAKASAVEICIHVNGHNVDLLVIDNGIGFDASEKYHGHGLKNIKMRAQSLHGTVSWQSAASGTHMRLLCEIK